MCIELHVDVIDEELLKRKVTELVALKPNYCPQFKC